MQLLRMSRQGIRPRRIALFLCAAALTAVWTGSVLASEGKGHADPVAPVLLALFVILFAAKAGSEVFERMGQPSVLGELIAGVFLGNLILVNSDWSFFEPLREAVVTEHWAVVIDSLARLGGIILLFEVGLESTVAGLRKVGIPSLGVAVLGMVAPFVLGFGVSWAFMSDLPAKPQSVAPAGFSPIHAHLFVGAILCATSVGITARVFKDLGRLQMKEAQIILGAAVIDDVLGLIILAVVSGVVTAAGAGQPLEVMALVQLVVVAVLFLGGSMVLGVTLVPRILTQLARLRTAGVMLISALLFAFVLAYLANAAGLAAIIGAFAAGLILEEVHFRGFRDEITIHQLLQPVSTLLVPIFFVLMGTQVRLEAFADLSVLGVAASLTVAAIVGKQVCGLGVLEKGVDRMTVGLGMIPRGEVGLIIAGIGKHLQVIDDAMFSAIVIMVIVTTLITPPLLKMCIGRLEHKPAEAG